MKHLLIILSFLLLSSPVIGDNHKGETLYLWGEYPGYKWMEFGDKNTRPQYKGEVENGKPNGLGVLIYPYNGKSIVGEYKDGKKDGQGTWTSTDGRKYVGEWKDGKRNGQGTYTYPDGRKYVGEYKDGKKYGQGTNTWSDGRKYVGKFKNGLPNGKGTETSPDGWRYVGKYNEGKWKDGKYNGQGWGKTWSRNYDLL